MLKGIESGCYFSKTCAEFRHDLDFLAFWEMTLKMGKSISNKNYSEFLLFH